MAIKVTIDCGHGGGDAGTSVGKVNERDLNLKIGQAAGQVLRAHKYPVIFTRTSNEERPALTQRGRVASKGDLCFVIHINAADSPVPSGVRLYHMPREANAQAVAAAVLAAYPKELISKTSRAIEAVKDGNFERVRNVLKYALCPSVLIECGFMTNDTDRALLQDPQIHLGIAAAILSATRALETSNVVKLPNV